MAQVLQLRRGTTAQNNTFTGAAGEVTVDTDRESLRVHDGSTMGGKEIADLQTAVPLLPAASSVSGSDTVPVIQSGVARRATKTQILNGIVNSNVDAAAAIAGTKIAPNFGSQNVVTAGSLTSAGATVSAADGEGGQINISNPDNNSSGLVIDVASQDTARIFSGRQNSDLQIGQLLSTGGTIKLFTGAAERLRIDASGNVGIGTSSPTARLHVAGSITATNGNIDLSQALYCAATLYSGSVQSQFAANAGGATDIRSVSNHPIRIYTNNIERMQIDANGNVGIGTSSPSFTLDVNGQINTRQTNGVGIFIAENSAIRNTSSAGTTMYFDSGAGAGSTGGNFDFRSTASYTSRLYINGTNGNVGVGTASPATRLHVDGTIRYTNRPAAGTITAIGFDANGDLRASSSSLRYKHNVEPYAKGLEEVAQLEPVTFNYNGEELVNAGLIVEDLDELGLEEFVLRDSEGTADAIPYGNMVALLINAIKELKVRVEELEAAQ